MACNTSAATGANGRDVRALIDTNVLIDHLAGVEAARDELARHADPAISAVTWMEVMVGAADDREAARDRPAQ